MTRRSFEPLPSLAIAGAVVVTAGLAGLATATNTAWYDALQRPIWQPPPWVFGPVWTTLYVLLALSGILIWHRSGGSERRRWLTVFGLNLLLNALWSALFFRAHLLVLSGVEIVGLWLTIVGLIGLGWRLSRLAAAMLVPYLLWVSLATALTWTIVGLNR